MKRSELVTDVGKAIGFYDNTLGPAQSVKTVMFIDIKMSCDEHTPVLSVWVPNKA